MLSVSELPNDCYAVSLPRDLQPGDVCVAVPVPDTNRLSDVFDLAGGSQDLALRACWMRVVVIRVFEGLAVVAPIMTIHDAGDDSAFETVVEAARNSDNWIRLPPLDGEWRGDAVVCLFMPHTIPAELLMDRRATSLKPPAREIFVQRVARAFLP